MDKSITKIFKLTAIMVGIICIALNAAGCADISHDIITEKYPLETPKIIDNSDLVPYDDNAKNEILAAIPSIVKKSFISDSPAGYKQWDINKIAPLNEAGRYFGGTYYGVAEDVGGEEMANSSWLVSLAFLQAHSADGSLSLPKRCYKEGNILVVKTKSGWEPWFTLKKPISVPLRFVFKERKYYKSSQEANIRKTSIDESGPYTLVEKAYEAEWNFTNGSITLDANSINLEIQGNMEGWKTTQASTTSIIPPIKGIPDKVTRIFLENTDKGLVELAGYDYTTKDNSVYGKLLLGTFNGTQETWRPVYGEMMSIAADYYPKAVKAGNRIYLDAKEGNKVKVIDLGAKELQVKYYEPGNNAIKQATEMVSEITKMFEPEMLSPPILGSYGNSPNEDTLLVAMGTGSKQCVTALQYGQVIGRILVDGKKKELTIFKNDGSETSTKLPVVTDYVMLP
jgi:hypothetical protein